MSGGIQSTSRKELIKKRDNHGVTESTEDELSYKNSLTEASASVSSTNGGFLSSSYKVVEEMGVYFITSTILNWVPLFNNENYAKILIDSLKFSQLNKNLEIFYYVIMDHHFHALVRSPKLSDVIRSVKGFTSHEILEDLKNNLKTEMLNIFERYNKHKDRSTYQVWQEGFHPQLINSIEMLNQKIEYTHNNPVKRGLVERAEDWRYSSLNNKDRNGTIIIDLNTLESI